MRQMSNRDFRRRMKEELLTMFERARWLADQDQWADGAAYAETKGDSAKVRTIAARPTEAIALHGYLEDSEKDRELRGKAALRRQREKSQRLALDAIVKLSNVMDGEAKKLERAMGHLRPGPSARNPRFEPAIRGDTTLGKAEMMATLEAQGRRRERGEAFGG